MPPQVAKVYRLKNGPAGEPYGIEKRTVPAMEEVAPIVGKWWASRGTVAVVVFALDGSEDARYERTWIARDRIPATWPSREGLQAKLIEQPESRPPSPVRVDGGDLVEAPVSKPTRPEGACLCCWRADAPTGALRHASPSSRLADGRCLECGSPSGMTAAELQAQYVAFQGKLGEAHARRRRR